MKKPLSQRIKERANPQQVVILALMLIPDSFAIALSAITAYNFRFPESSTLVDGKPAIAQFEYRGILATVVAAWIITLVSSGTYRFNHATLVVFNLRLIIKRSFTFFFLLGFLSFILKASFSRTVFLVMLASGLLYLFLVRIAVYGFILRPLILKKRVTSNLMIIGRDKNDLEEHSDWLIKNRKLGFTIAFRLVCAEINTAWVEEFDKLLRYKKITEVLLLPGMESDPFVFYNL